MDSATQHYSYIQMTSHEYIYLIFLIQLQTGPQQTIILLLINLPVIVTISCSVYKTLNLCENGHPDFQSPKPRRLLVYRHELTKTRGESSRLRGPETGKRLKRDLNY